MKPNTQKKGRHRNAPGRTERLQKDKLFEEYKAKIIGRGTFSSAKLARVISEFKKVSSKTENTRAFKPSGKKPISRPK